MVIVINYSVALIAKGLSSLHTFGAKLIQIFLTCFYFIFGPYFQGIFVEGRCSDHIFCSGYDLTMFVWIGAYEIVTLVFIFVAKWHAT